MLQHLGEGNADLLFQDLSDASGIHRAVLLHDLLRPVRVGSSFRIRPEVRAFDDPPGQRVHLVQQPRRQDGKAHHLDQADVFLLNMMELLVRVEDAQRILLCGPVVPERQIQLKHAVPHTCDRRDGVVGGSVRLRQHLRLRIAVAAPRGQDPVRQLLKPCRVRSVQTDHRHGPVHDPCLDVFKSREGQALPDPRPLHGEGVVPALEVLVGQDGAADDRQVRVGADGVVREHLHELQQPPEGQPFDLHGLVLTGQDYTVLVVVDIGRILHVPLLTAQHHRDLAQILTRRVVEASRVALVLVAQKAFRVGALLLQERRGDGLRILLRLRQVDGDVKGAVFRRGGPLPVPADAVAADVVGVTAHLIEPVRRLLRRIFVQFIENPDSLRRPGRETAHELRVEEIPLRDAAADHAAGLRVVQQDLQKALEDVSLVISVRTACAAASFRGRCRQLSGEFPFRLQLHHLKEPVHRIDGIVRADESRPKSVNGKSLHCFLCVHLFPPSPALLPACLFHYVIFLRPGTHCAEKKNVYWKYRIHKCR